MIEHVPKGKIHPILFCHLQFISCHLPFLDISLTFSRFLHSNDSLPTPSSSIIFNVGSILSIPDNQIQSVIVLVLPLVFLFDSFVILHYTLNQSVISHYQYTSFDIAFFRTFCTSNGRGIEWGSICHHSFYFIYTSRS